MVSAAGGADTHHHGFYLPETRRTKLREWIIQKPAMRLLEQCRLTSGVGIIRQIARNSRSDLEILEDTLIEQVEQVWIDLPIHAGMYWRCYIPLTQNE